MAARRKAMHNVGAFTDTVATQFADPASMFTPGWDAKVAGQQAMDRNKQRAKMGKKMVPRGPGLLIPSKR